MPGALELFQQLRPLTQCVYTPCIAKASGLQQRRKQLAIDRAADSLDLWIAPIQPRFTHAIHAHQPIGLLKSADHLCAHTLDCLGVPLTLPH